MALFKKKLSETDAASKFLDLCLENVDNAWQELKIGLKGINKELGIKGAKILSDDKGVMMLYCYTIALNCLAVRNLFGSETNMRIMAHITEMITGDNNKVSQEEKLVAEFLEIAFEEIQQGENPVEAVAQLFHFKVTGLDMLHLKDGNSTNPFEFTVKYGLITEIETSIAGDYWKQVQKNYALVP